MKLYNWYRTDIERVLLIAVILMLCSINPVYAQSLKSSQEKGTLMERARRAYLEGRYLAAMDLFGEAKAADPGNAQAFYGYARSGHALRHYTEALPAFEKAIELSPKDEDIWAGYIQALSWGGIFKNNSLMLTHVRDKGLAMLASWPDCAKTYESIWTALGKLNQNETLIPSLEAMQERFPNSPVLAIQLQGMRLQRAQGRKDQQGIDQIKDALRADIKAVGPDFLADNRLSPAQLYKVANIYRLLGEQEKYEATVFKVKPGPPWKAMAYWFESLRLR